MIQWVGAGGEVAGDWTPAEIDTLLWLDADDEDTITLASGTSVSQWADKSGNANHMTSVTSTQQPLYDTTNTINGMAVITFDGAAGASGDRLSKSSLTSFPTNATGYTAVMVYRRVSATLERILVDVSDGAGTNRTWTWLDDYAALVRDIRSRVSDTGVDDGFYSGANPPGVAVVSGFGCTTKRQSFFNGDAGTPNTNSRTLRSATVVQIGINTSSTQSHNCNIGELVIFEGENNTNRQLVEGYMAWKWGLQADLVATHPYKSIPPMI
jgi:hypothetical protein